MKTTAIRIPIGDHSLESSSVGLKLGRPRPVVVDGRRTYVLAEPVSYYASLRDALNGVGKKIRRGEIVGFPVGTIVCLEELLDLIELSRLEVAKMALRIESQASQ